MMSLITYYAVLPILYGISLLPFRAVYLLSDFVFFIVYYLVRYRRNTVNSNIRLALPHLNAKQVKIIELKFYRFMCDMFLEMVKTISISEKEIDERFVFKNLDLYLELEKKSTSIILMCSHYASYEWVLSMNRKIDFQGFAIYKPINNKYFDDFVKKVRSRFKTDLVAVKEASNLISNNLAEKIKGVYGFAGDQSPENKKKYYWTNFFGTQVPVYTGAELLSRRFDLPVVFLNVSRVRRGFYEAEFELMDSKSGNLKEFTLTREYLSKVERQICAAPEFYFWTHKRFKHAGKKHLSY